MQRKEPRDKALEMVNKFLNPEVIIDSWDQPTWNVLTPSAVVPEKLRKEQAKQAAVVACDEIISADPLSPHDGSYYELVSDRQVEVRAYWENVKHEIKTI